jgi:glycosyltransferase involved in cell wall biosynthesis
MKSRLTQPLTRVLPSSLALRLARAVIVLNAEDATRVRRLRPRADASTILRARNGTNAAIPRQVGSPTPVVLFVGSWLPRKGTELLVSASTTLARDGLNFRVQVAGSGLPADCVRNAWPADVRDRVHVVSAFSQPDEAPMFAGADVFVLPSIFEGQPLALLQAMASGCCCVGADVPGISDVLQDGVNGILVRSGDAEALTEALRSALTSAPLRDRLAAAAAQAMDQRRWASVSNEVVRFVTTSMGSLPA